jgi:hypothetical protein
VLLAHQGGWDESLLVIGPLAILTLLLQVARRRAEREQAAELGEPEDAPQGTDDPAPPPA